MLSFNKHPIPRVYAKNEFSIRSYPNQWDAIALCLVLAILALFGLGARGMATPYHLGEPIVISFGPHLLALLRLSQRAAHGPGVNMFDVIYASGRYCRRQKSSCAAPTHPSH